MKTRLRALVLMFGLAAAPAHSQPHSSDNTVVAAALASSITIHQILSKADVALTKSVINASLLRGEVGEAIHDRTVGHFLKETGKWEQVSPRLGSQGLDHVSVKLDASGVPRGLMVDETKFGNSRPGKTVGGDLQIGRKWTDDRLRALASRFRVISRHVRSGIELESLPTGLSSRQSIRVPLGDGSMSVSFWRRSSQHPWRFNGSAPDLKLADRQLNLLADYFDAAAKGKIDYARRLFHVSVKGNDLHLTMMDARSIEQVNGVTSKLPVTGKMVIPMKRNDLSSNDLQRLFNRELRRNLGHLSSEDAALMTSRAVVLSRSAEDLISTQSFWGNRSAAAAKGAGLAVLVAAPLDAGLQWLFQERVDWMRVGKTTIASASAGGLASISGASMTSALIKNPLGYSLSMSAARALGMSSASRFANLAGGATEGGMAVAIYSYGMWAMGEMDLRTANRSTLAGGIGSLAGVGASAAAYGLVSAYGAASTGTAISTLGGTVANGATLAWFGGGSLASGGAGTAGGTLVLSGGTLIVVFVASAVVMEGFHLYDEHQDNERIRLCLGYLAKPL